MRTTFADFGEDDSPDDHQHGGGDGRSSLEPLAMWTAKGFPARRARRWIACGVGLVEAERWLGSGVYQAEEAMAWRTARITPYTVGPAVRAGLSPARAVRWHEFGYSLTEAIERHLAGEQPSLRRRRWRTRGRGLHAW